MEKSLMNAYIKNKQQEELLNKYRAIVFILSMALIAVANLLLIRNR